MRGCVIKPQSCKAKGRVAQKRVAQKISEAFDLPETDVKSLPMGSPGADIWLSQKARESFPFEVEVKNVEKLNVHKAFQQAIQHWEKTGEYDPPSYPLLVHTKNRGELLATLRFDDLLELLKRVLP